MTFNTHKFSTGLIIDWNFKYIEKTNKELKIYSYITYQLYNFLVTFFYFYGFKVLFIRLFFDKFSLYVFISYFYQFKNYRNKNKNSYTKILKLNKNNVNKKLYLYKLLQRKRYVKLKFLKNLKFYKNINFKFFYSLKRVKIFNFLTYLKIKNNNNILNSIFCLFFKKLIIILNILKKQIKN